MSDDDFQALLLKVEALLDENPNLTATEIEAMTGADFEDVLWAMAVFK